MKRQPAIVEDHLTSNKSAVICRKEKRHTNEILWDSFPFNTACIKLQFFQWRDIHPFVPVEVIATIRVGETGSNGVHVYLEISHFPGYGASHSHDGALGGHVMWHSRHAFHDRR